MSEARRDGRTCTNLGNTWSKKENSETVDIEEDENGDEPEVVEVCGGKKEDRNTAPNLPYQIQSFFLQSWIQKSHLGTQFHWTTIWLKPFAKRTRKLKTNLWMELKPGTRKELKTSTQKQPKTIMQLSQSQLISINNSRLISPTTDICFHLRARFLP